MFARVNLAEWGGRSKVIEIDSGMKELRRLKKKVHT